MLDHVVSIMWPSKTAWGARQLAAGGPTARLAGQGEANRQKAVGGGEREERALEGFSALEAETLLSRGSITGTMTRRLMSEVGYCTGVQWASTRRLLSV